MIKFIMKSFIKKVFFRFLRLFSRTLEWKLNSKSQNNNEENLAIAYIAKNLKCDNSFIEFGFDWREFNCINLVKSNFRGLLIDANQENCDIANYIFNKLNLKTKALKYWLSLDSLEPIYEFCRMNNNKLGVLSVDVDGNDYWLLSEILKKIKPEIIVTEYNASYGLRPISSEYKKYFNRFDMHKSGFYGGASITAFFNLLSPDYFLIKNIYGLNLIFIRKDKTYDGIKPLSAKNGYKEHIVRNKISKTNAKDQWKLISNLQFSKID